MKKIILLIIEKIRKALKVDEKGNSFEFKNLPKMNIGKI